MTRSETDTVQDALSSGAADRLHALDVFDTVPSTNTWLIDQSPPEPGQYRVAIADHQTAGRGRHSNRWHSAPESSLCLSMSYTFLNTPQNLPPLTLALGVSVAELGGLIDHIATLPNLALRGLMAIPAASNDPDTMADRFTALAGLFADCRDRAAANPATKWDTLSMGMSGDYRLAIVAGSTIVRIGTAIFGQRSLPT